MILRQILHKVEAAQGPVNLNDLSRELGIERGALDGMIAYWVRRGRLKHESDAVCTRVACELSCQGEKCPLF